MEYRYLLSKEEVLDKVSKNEKLYCFNGESFEKTTDLNQPLYSERVEDYVFSIEIKEKVLLNRCQCLLCNDIITSESTHSFVRCKCGDVYSDGGKSYIRRGATDLNKIKDLSCIVLIRKDVL